jgi:hypothetical protein
MIRKAYAAGLFLFVIGCSVAISAQSTKPRTAGFTGDGNVRLDAAPGNRIISLTTKLKVPPEPAKIGTLFLWPGLQPDPQGTHFLPIDNGVLQSVLTWGRSCAAESEQPAPYQSWWISAQYVNTCGKYANYMGCSSGHIMLVKRGDVLSIKMDLAGSKWMQTVVNLRTGQSVGFPKDMPNQAQSYAWFSIEPHDGASIADDITFVETTMELDKAGEGNCHLGQHGSDDFISTQVVKDGGKSCYIEKIVLKLRGS